VPVVLPMAKSGVTVATMEKGKLMLYTKTQLEDEPSNRFM